MPKSEAINDTNNSNNINNNSDNNIIKNNNFNNNKEIKTDYSVPAIKPSKKLKNKNNKMKENIAKLLKLLIKMDLLLLKHKYFLPWHKKSLNTINNSDGSIIMKNKKNSYKKIIIENELKNADKKNIIIPIRKKKRNK